LVGKRILIDIGTRVHYCWHTRGFFSHLLDTRLFEQLRYRARTAEKKELAIEILRTIDAMRSYSSTLRQSGKTIAFVPTMGFLHKGHLSLMKKGRELADRVVVSIFVNPIQFGPGEDLAAYPRDEARDLEMTGETGVDAVFIPDAKQMYPEGFQTTIALKALPGHLCGLSRPGHFDGVATVVAKLLGIVRPDLAIFGEKDYQQFLVVRQMVRDLDLDVDIVGAPIVREADGLAMSSRNMYLADDQRKAACSLYRTLTESKKRVKAGETRADTIIASAEALIQAHPETRIDYIAVCDPSTLDAVTAIDGPVLMALAVKVGRARLIDNMLLTP
jgi:pantoate--beta-alanine ligase